MAHTLKENHSYSLLTNEENLGKRKVYFVKLTDSCLKALEEHIIFQAATKSKPSVKFNGLNGVFTIPSKPGSASQDVGKKFQFTVSSLIESGSNQGNLECIKHPDRKKSQLVSYGELSSRLLIAATDDVYENTRNRMAQVDQERKDVRTKEIELGNIKKKKRNNTRVIPDTSYNKIAAMKKKFPAHPNNSTKTATTLSTNVRHSSPPVSSTNRNSPATVGKSFTCRERVLHILAIRPYKKPELISRLQREAMSSKDRNNLAMVLQQISSTHDNQYQLHSHLYKEVKIDTWPFYTESERSTVKSNIETHKKTENKSPPQLVSSTSKSPEEKPLTRKRPISDNNGSVKRPKILSSIKNDEPTSTTSTDKVVKKNLDDINDKNKMKKENKAPGEESPPTVASTSDSPEYLTTYKPITSYDQRCQYKRAFQSEYPEYIELKKNVDAVATKFIELDRSWRRQEKGSPDYLRIQDEIIEAYQKHQKDEKYHEMKRRCEELHQKLSHIKKLVVEYDSALQT